MNKDYFPTMLLLASLLSCSNIENKFKHWIPNDNSRNAPKVISSIPSPNAEGVAKDQPVVFTFNKEIEQQSCIGAFSIQPPISGLFEFTGTVMKFKPSSKFRGGITYVINLSRRCEDKEGRDLEKAYNINFTADRDTTEPEIISATGKKYSSGCGQIGALVEIANFQSGNFSPAGLCRDTPVILNFSKPMNRGSVEGNLLIIKSMQPGHSVLL